MQKKRRLLDEYRFPGFGPKAAIKGIFGEPDARVIKLDRQKKNGLRFMRYSALESLRQEGALDPGFILRGRKKEYARLSGKDRTYIKGQKYTLLSNRENLTLDGRKALKKLLTANKRLNTAYLLKESFGQLWSYQTEGWASKFFNNWKESPKWQKLKPYERFVEMIKRHWDGIAAYSRPENKVSLGFVEGFNNKIRVIQRRAYGFRDEEYLRLKILTCMLKEI